MKPLRKPRTRLIALGKQEAGGLKWAMSPRFPRLMPNFSHGTAGIAYFLATLYSETKDAECSKQRWPGPNTSKLSRRPTATSV